MTALVAVHRDNGVHALNVLAASLRADARFSGLPIVFAKTDEEITAAARAHERPIVAWSFYSPEAAKVAADLQSVRRAIDRDDVLHVAGGVHASAEPMATLKAGFDLVALGEGEKTIRDLVDAHLHGRDLREVRGLGRLEDGVYRDTGTGDRIELDDFPAFDVVDRKFNAIEITRGCIYACKFCQTPFMFKARFRHRSIENVAEHVRIMRRERLRYVRFVTPTSLSYGSDDTTPNLDAVEALLAAVREAIGPEGRIYFGTFPSEVRPEHVTDEALRRLKKWVDNDNLVIGGQSGSQRVLDQTRRDHSVDDVVRAVRTAVARGFVPNVDFLFGLPGERDDDVRATVDLMRTLTDAGARVHSHAFMPLPGTPLKDSPLGVIAEPVRRELARLEAQGKSYGQWRKQLVAAESLVARRSGDPRA